MTNFRDKPPEQEVDEGKLPVLEDGQYPPNATTDNARLRFRMCLGIARLMFPDEEGTGADEALIWQTSRSLFNDPNTVA